MPAKTAKRHVAAIVSATSDWARRTKLHDRVVDDISDLWGTAPGVTGDLPSDDDAVGREYARTRREPSKAKRSEKA